MCYGTLCCRFPDSSTSKYCHPLGQKARHAGPQTRSGTETEEDSAFMASSQTETGAKFASHVRRNEMTLERERGRRSARMINQTNCSGLCFLRCFLWAIQSFNWKIWDEQSSAKLNSIPRSINRFCYYKVCEVLQCMSENGVLIQQTGSKCMKCLVLQSRHVWNVE